MLWNSKGFTLFEVLVSFSLLMMIIVTIVPLVVLIETERNVLLDRRQIASQLHDQLQEKLLLDDEVSVSDGEVTFTFKKIGDFMKGCATWENRKQQQDDICFYGLP